MKWYVIILSLLLQGYSVPCVHASQAGSVWQDAVEEVNQGAYDFAYMDFRTILETSPDSPYALRSQFALGEYFFIEKNLPLAAGEFKNFCSLYPHREEALIALVYLFKMAQMENKSGVMKKYRSQIASFGQHNFIFNEKKSFKFKSAFQRRYRLITSLNKVELYVNNQLFTEVSF